VGAEVVGKLVVAEVAGKRVGGALVAIGAKIEHTETFDWV